MTPTLVLSRSPPDSDRFAALVAARARVATLVSPAFDIVPLPASITPAPAHVAFTSVRGVEQAERFDLRAAHAWCVGARTCQIARAAGFQATDGGGDVLRLAQTIIAASPVGEIVHLRGRHVAGDLVGALTAGGLTARSVICYEQCPRPPSEALLRAVQGVSPLVFPLFSPRAALLLAGLDGPAPCHVIAISPAVAAAVEGFPIETVTVAQTPTEAEMVETCLDVLRKLEAATST